MSMLFHRRFSVKVFRCLAWLLICTFCLPAPLAVNAAPTHPTALNASDAEPWNRHVFERWNSPERARALEEAARIESAAREAYERGEVAAVSSPSFPAQAGNPDSSALTADGEKTLDPGLRRGDGMGARGDVESVRPQSMTEVLFNYAAGFAGVPGLAPRGVDGSLDEGLGFHQDGTARRAGGVNGASGPSDNGQRARTYMQSGLQGGYGQGYGAGFGQYGNGLYDSQFGGLWGRNDPTRGGRIGAGNSYSRELGDFDPMSMAIDRGLNYGAGFLNSMGEAGISSLVDGGRARLNFRLDRDGYFSGEGDALLPFYDGKYTTFYTQLGARSMHDSSDTRWIGNFGLGQRWFPFAEGDDPKSGGYDAGMLMLGYNAFFDYDFTRDHQRGGIGAEAQYDWFRLATNYYFPLSSWRGSEDFDSRFVKERPAEGWDARVKAYLPFYRNVALTGAYSQWYGDHVGMFGADHLEKDPKVWSYGLEYTPIPLVSGFITQKSTERGRSDTEFGLNFTYHFGMPWEDQTSHSKVAELRTVGGSRHEFVDRENRIILEYKAKNAYQIELVRYSGNTFTFRIRDGFDKFKAGQVVRVTAGGGVTLAEAPAVPEEKSLFAHIGGAIVDFFSVSTAHAADFSQTYTTDGNGEFVVRVSSPVTDDIILTVRAGEHSESFTVGVVANQGLTISPATLPNAVVNEAYSQTFTAGGGSGSYTFSLENSTLPGTFSFTPGTATLSGTPTATGSYTFTIRVTDTSDNSTADKNYTLTVGAASYSIAFDQASYSPSFSGSGANAKASQSVVITVLNVSAGNVPVNGATVTLAASMNDAQNLAIVSGRRNQYYGLSVNSSAGGATFPVTFGTTDGSGQVTLSLEDIVGERKLTLTASVTPLGGSAVAQSAAVQFGAGPLQYFSEPLTGPAKRWADNAPISDGGNSAVINFPAAYACGTSLSASQLQGLTGYDARTKLPSRT